MNKLVKFFDDKAAEWDAHEIKSKDFFDQFVKENLHLKKGMKVLDLACGTGVISDSIYKISKTDVVGMDISSKMIECAKNKNHNSNIHFIAKDFYQNDLKGFDAIVVHNAYPHFIDRVKFKAKVLEALNPNGLLIICHSISRYDVNHVHEKVDPEISLRLLPAEKEAIFFQKQFKIIDIKDSDIYTIILQKQ